MMAMAKKGADPAVAAAREVERLRDLCSEMYQVAGELGASEQVLDNLWAAAGGKPLPHETLLAYGDERNPKAAPLARRTSTRKHVSSAAPEKSPPNARNS